MLLACVVLDDHQSALGYGAAAGSLVDGPSADLLEHGVVDTV